SGTYGGRSGGNEVLPVRDRSDGARPSTGRSLTEGDERSDELSGLRPLGRGSPCRGRAHAETSARRWMGCRKSRHRSGVSGHGARQGYGAGLVEVHSRHVEGAREVNPKPQIPSSKTQLLRIWVLGFGIWDLRSYDWSAFL